MLGSSLADTAAVSWWLLSWFQSVEETIRALSQAIF